MYKFIRDLSSPGIEAHGGGSMYAVVLGDDDVVSSCVLPAYLLTSRKEGSVCVAVGVANCSVKCCASRSESASKICSRLQSNKLIYNWNNDNIMMMMTMSRRRRRRKRKEDSEDVARQQR